MFLAGTLNEEKNVLVALYKESLTDLALYPFFLFLEFFVISSISMKFVFSILASFLIIDFFVLFVRVFLHLCFVLWVVCLFIIQIYFLSLIQVLAFLILFGFELLFLLCILLVLFLLLIIHCAIDSAFLSSDESLKPATENGIDVLRLFETVWSFNFLRFFDLR